MSSPSEEDPRLTWGRRYIARGWKVFVLGRSKTPLKNCDECQYTDFNHQLTCDHLHCHGFYAATDDIERLRLMLDNPLGGLLAVRTGSASGIVVFDFESTDKDDVGFTGNQLLETQSLWEEHVLGWHLPQTLTARTASDGRHKIYRFPDRTAVPSRNRILGNTDLKADGGYVALPCGLDGREWLDWSAEVVELPQEAWDWYDGVRERRGQAGGSGGLGIPPEELAQMIQDGPPRGQRDEFWRDFSLRRFREGRTKDEILAEAWLIFQRMDNPWEDYFQWDWVVYKVERDSHRIQPAPELRRGYLSFVERFTLQSVAVTGIGESDPRDETQPHAGNPAVLNEPPDFETELSETGNVHRFARLFEGRFVFVPDVGWHVWTGVRWRLDVVDDVLEATQDILLDIQRERENIAASDPDREANLRRWYQTSSSIKARAAIVRGAQVDSRMKIAYDQLNVDPLQLVTQDGTLDLEQLRWRRSRPRDFNTQQAAVTYDKNARCPLWLKHIELITQTREGRPDPHLAAYLQRWAGYTLTGLVDAQKFFFGYGGGSNGKNVFIETLLNMLGTYAIRGSAQLLSGNGREHETIVADIAGARMVFIDETPSGRVNENRIKALTGSSRARARRMKQDTFEFDVTAKLWIAGNNKPMISDTTKGFWRRLALVPFDTTIEGKMVIPDYASELKREWPGILNWCLEGLRGYLECGDLGEPERVREAGDEYRDEESTFQHFVEEYFDPELPHEWTPNSALHAAYVQWSSEQGVARPPTMRRLADEWKRAGFRRDDSPRTYRVGGIGKWTTQRGWVGPALRSVQPEHRWPDAQPRTQELR